MNRLPFLVLLLPIAFFLSGATVVVQASESPASGYELGKSKGFEDGVNGLSRTPARYETVYSQADRADFLRGYEDGYNAGIKPGAKLPQDYSHGRPLRAVNGLSTVVIMEGSRKVAVCHTASPNIEETKLIKEQQQIVIKSRGNHGPATVQLFDSFTGRPLGSVKAYEIKNGTPGWATGMGE